MKAAIRDPNTLKSIEPSRVASYLEMRGWHQENYIPEKASIWTLSDRSEEQFEVLLPLNPSFKDYAIRISQILKTLEAVEQRSQSEILLSRELRVFCTHCRKFRIILFRPIVLACCRNWGMT